MPEWSEPKKKLTAEGALAQLREAKEKGAHGSMELDGEEALKLIEALDTDGDVPIPPGLVEMLKSITGDSGFELGGIKIVKISDLLKDEEEKAEEMRPGWTPEKQALLDHYISVRAEDDEDFWNSPRQLFEGGPDTTLREIKQHSESIVEAAEEGVATGTEGGLALAVLWLIERYITGSNLLRDAQKIIQLQKVRDETGARLLAEAQAKLKQYADHMVIEHGVAPDEI